MGEGAVVEEEERAVQGRNEEGNRKWQEVVQ